MLLRTRTTITSTKSRSTPAIHAPSSHPRLYLQNTTLQSNPSPTQYYMKGYCRNESSCQFAHGSRDLHGMVIASSAPIAPDYGQAGQFL